MMYALIESPRHYRCELFPTRLERREKVIVISTVEEIDRLKMMLCVPPISGETYLYLMADRRTNLTKIGTSKNPKYRERTLQSDNPLIDLLWHWEANLSDERYLHQRFETKRMRGEWFDLTDADIQFIALYMHNKRMAQDAYNQHQDELAEMKHKGQRLRDNLDISLTSGLPITVVPITDNEDTTAEG